MDDQQKLRTLLPATGAGAGAVLLLLLVGNLFWDREPFESERRAGKRLSRELEVESSVDARLWQDPIQALSDYLQDQRRQASSSSPEAQSSSRLLVERASVDDLADALEELDRAAEISRDPERFHGIPDLSPDPFQALSDALRAFQDLKEEAEQGAEDHEGVGANSPFNAMFSAYGARSSGRSLKGLVITVALRGDSSSEIGEERLRQRIALISALGLRGFVPVDEGRLSFFGLRRGPKGFEPVTRLFQNLDATKRENRDSQSALKVLSGLNLPREDSSYDEDGEARSGSSQRVYVAVEHFKRDPFVRAPHHTADGVLVIWLNEEILQDSSETPPLDQLSKILAGAIEGADLSKQIDLEESMKFALIGPATSASLGQILVPFLPDQQGQGSCLPITRNPFPTLGQVANAYLDSPLSGDEKVSLDLALPTEEDRAYAKVIEPLRSYAEELLVGTGIEDSDPEWPHTVSVRWLIAPKGPLQGAESGESDSLDVLRIEADQYLDDGLPDRPEFWDTEEVASRLDALLSAVPSADMGLKCILRQLERIEHSDSDPAWRRSVAVLWLLTEPWGDEVRAHQDLVKEIRVYSGRATAPLPLVHVSSVFQAEKGGVIRGGCDAFEAALEDAPFVSTVASDEILAALLLDELQRRGVDPVDGEKDHIALISEWDTLYGRALPFVIEAEIQRRRTPDLDLCNDILYGMRLNSWGSPPARVHRFSYLRGLDGVAPGEGQTGIGSAGGGPGGSERPRADRPGNQLHSLERAEGKSQLDQIRRVGDEIVALDRTLTDRNQGRIRAIGVLGSDHYDKDLVLQAIRDQFPRAVFFTTDLDARQLDPRAYDWNHNLVVASSFGLALDPSLQCHIPPFRDSYSTATFLAGLAALEDADAYWRRSGSEGSTEVGRQQLDEEAERGFRPCYPLVSSSEVRELLRPRIFEIGRGRAFDLTPEKPALDGNVKAVARSLQPKRTDEGHLGRRIVLGSSLLVLVPILLILAGPVTRVAGAPRRGKLPSDSDTSFVVVAFKRNVQWVLARGWLRRVGVRALVGIGAALLLGTLALIAFASDRSGTGEPLGWVDGVSVWPSEFLRLFGVCLTFVLFLRAAAEIRESNRRLEKYFVGGDSPTFIKEKRPGLKRSLRRAFGPRGVDGWRSLIERRARRGGVSSLSSAWAIWCRYRRLGAVRVVLLRVAGWSLMAAFGVLVLLYFLGFPNVPARGALARWVDYVLVFASSLGLVVLTLFVFDVTRLGSCFVDSLSVRGTRWPKTTVNQRIAEGLGMTLDNISDLLAIRVVADRTETVGKLVLYPFLVMIPLLLSRSRLFDDWDWPWSVIAVLVLLLVLALGSSVLLRRAAVRARRATLERLEGMRVRSLRNGVESAPSAQQIEALMSEIRGIDRGALGPWTTNPVLGALLLPFGGAGLAGLLELFVRLWS